jgi:hypothetical protein
MAWNRQLYLPSKGSLAMNFIALNILSSCAGFEHANIGSNVKHVNQ